MRSRTSLRCSRPTGSARCRVADAGAEDRDTARSGRRASGGADALGRILEDGERLAATDNTLRRSGLSVPNGANSDEVADLLEAFAAVEVELAWQQTGYPWLTSPTSSTPGVVIAGQPATCANWPSVCERLPRTMETSHSRALAEGFSGRACRGRSQGAGRLGTNAMTGGGCRPVDRGHLDDVPDSHRRARPNTEFLRPRVRSIVLHQWGNASRAVSHVWGIPTIGPVRLPV